MKNFSFEASCRAKPSLSLFPRSDLAGIVSHTNSLANHIKLLDGSDAIPAATGPSSGGDGGGRGRGVSLRMKIQC